MLNENNVLVQLVRCARDRFDAADINDLHFCLINSRYTDGCFYNTPSASEVASLIIGELSPLNYEHEVIVHHKQRGLQWIYNLYPSFMVIQYSPLFPWGEDGYRFRITYRNSCNAKFRAHNKLTMREFYSFQPQVCSLKLCSF